MNKPDEQSRPRKQCRPSWGDEDVVTMSEAGKHYPKPTSPSTVTRHALKPNRYGVQLESFHSGGRRYTTKQSIYRYIDRTTEAAAGRQAGVTDSDRATAAEAELSALMVQRMKI